MAESYFSTIKIVKPSRYQLCSVEIVDIPYTKKYYRTFDPTPSSLKLHDGLCYGDQTRTDIFVNLY